jgi:hypothetical protein
MTQKEQIGAVLLVGFFGFLAVVLYFTMDDSGGSGRGIENNVIIEQRLKQKSNN